LKLPWAYVSAIGSMTIAALECAGLSSALRPFLLGSSCSSFHLCRIICMISQLGQCIQRNKTRRWLLHRPATHPGVPGREPANEKHIFAGCLIFRFFLPMAAGQVSSPAVRSTKFRSRVLTLHCNN
jgi:hypothetical protein